MRILRVALLAASLIAGCSQASPQPSAASDPASPRASTGPVGNLPEGCEPIELRSPSGERVDLDGIWVQDAAGNTQAMKWWLWSFGDCLWGAGRNENYSEEPFASADQVQAFRGTIRDDFTIETEMVLLAPHRPTETPIREAEVRILISIDEDGGITLREDREPGAIGPRCLTSSFCPAPLVLRPQDP
jgi:hypothetical protein